MFDEVLLAKRAADPAHPQEAETLAGHTENVVEAAVAIMTRLRAPLAETFRLTGEAVARIEAAVLRGALLHDLGKANDHFQWMVRGRPGRVTQALRHEWISAWLPLHLSAFRAWLFGEDLRLASFVLAGVLGHHLKAQEVTPRKGSGRFTVECAFDHPGFVETLRRGGKAIGLPEPPRLDRVTIDLSRRPLRELRQWLARGMEDLDPRPMALVKALTMAADLAGSALPVKGERDIGAWVAETLGRCCERAQLEGIVKERLAGRAPRPFQREVAARRARVILVRAGCGSGKTAAAYLWAAQRAAGRKLFFCYPTTGTATEGFRDYIVETGMGGASALLHGRSEIDIERILEAEPFSPSDRGFGVSALVAWDVPVTLCTVDRVLGIIQNARTSLYSSPAFMNAAFVFDEIHQYDGRLFGALLRFIEAFSGAPILLMTASLPRHRLERLQALLGGAFEIVAGPREHEAVQRYILSDPVEEAPWDAVGEVLERGGKVLWVSNRVDRCVAVGRTGEARFPSVPIFPYHSRYRYRDRVTRHEALISAFREAGAAFAVTTQVCEVSLDISADLLVSDLAPVPSLIQRLGRLNRRASPEAPGRPCRAFFLHPSSPAPYEEADLAVAEAWLGALSGRSVSQRDLAEAFERTVPEGEEGGVLPSEWLDGGKVSRRAPLREAGVTITVLRAEDAEAIEAGPGMRKAILANGIPMLLPPVQEGIAPWPLLGHASVAPKGAIAYDVRWGATWRKNPGRPERHDRLR